MEGDVRRLAGCGGLAIALLAMLGPAQVEAATPVPWVTDGPVTATAHVGHTIYLGGGFTQVGPRTGALVTVNPTTGKLIGAFPAVEGGAVNAILAAPGGGWYLGGSFTTIGGKARAGLARILPDGSLDGRFHPAVAGGSVLALVLVGTNVLVGGAFDHVAGAARANLALVDDTTGSIVNWTPNPNGSVNALAAVPSATDLLDLFVGGAFTTFDGAPHANLVGLSLLDQSFLPTPSLDGPVNALAVAAGTNPNTHLASSLVYVGGAFTSPTHLARFWLGSSTADASFTPIVEMVPRAIIADADSVFVAGDPATWPVPGLLALQSTNGGTRWYAGQGRSQRAIVRVGSRLLSGGTRGGFPESHDVTTGNGGYWPLVPGGDINAIATDGGATTVVVGGDFATVNGAFREGLAAIDDRTGRPTSWNPGCSGEVTSMGVGGGLLYVGGLFATIGGRTRLNLAALHLSSGVPTAWRPDPDGTVFALLVDGQRIIIGGNFYAVDSVERPYAAAISVAGDVLPWEPRPDSYVTALARDRTRIYLAGPFTRVHGNARAAGVAAVGRLTGAVVPWYPTPDVLVTAIAPAGTSVFLAGSFTRLGTVARAGLGAVSTRTGLATAFKADVDGPIGALVADSRSLFLVGGFRHVRGVAANRVAALDLSAARGRVRPWHPSVSQRDIYRGLEAVVLAPGRVILLGIGETYLRAGPR
jgi:hypothetical protein